jgi:hypothetical protein
MHDFVRQLACSAEPISTGGERPLAEMGRRKAAIGPMLGK